MKLMIKLISGVVIGGLIGFAFYWFTGCTTGTCPLTSNPWISTICGMAIGAAVARNISPKQKTG